MLSCFSYCHFEGGYLENTGSCFEGTSAVCTIPKIKMKILQVLSEGLHVGHSICSILASEGEAMSSTMHCH